MATNMDRACDEDELVYRCDGCGGVLEPWDADPPVIYYCFHVLHADCADGRDACPRCHTPRLVADDEDDQPEPVDESAPASPPPDNNPDEYYSALASDDGVGMGNDVDHPAGGGEFEPANSESPASMSGSECKCNHASSLGCCSHELESRFQEKSTALTTEGAQSRLCRLEEMYEKLEEEELIRLRERDGKRPREIEDAGEEKKKPRNGGRSVSSFPPQDQTD